MTLRPLFYLKTNFRGTNAGGISEEATPVPIPNTAVKLLRVDGTYSARSWESRSLPALVPLMKHDPKHKYIRALLPGLILCFGSFVYSAETFSNASMLDGKSWSVSAYGRSVKTEPIVHFSGGSGAADGSAVVISNTDADVKMTQQASDVTLALNVRPRDGLVYSVYVGQIQDFELQFSSGSQTNTLKSMSAGLRWGLGVSGMVSPLSPVSLGVTWSLAYTQTRLDLDQLHGGDQVYSVDELMLQQELQGALQATYRWKTVEPYVGLKAFRTHTRLDDKVSKQRVSGDVNGISPLLGCRWAMFDREFLQVEASFVDEKSLTAGLNIQF